MMPEIGVADWTFAASTEVAFEQAKAFGLHQIQVDFGPTLQGGAARATRLQGLANATGIRVTAVGVRLLNRLSFLHDMDTCRKLICAALDFASQLDVRQVFFPMFYENRNAYNLANAAGALSWACERAGRLGITVAVESAQSAGEIAQLLLAVAGWPLCVVADTYNPQTEGNDFEELILAHSAILMPFLHLKDGLAGRMGIARLGQGDGDVARRFRSAMTQLEPQSIIIENKFSIEYAFEELRHDVTFVMQQLAEMRTPCPVGP